MKEFLEKLENLIIETNNKHGIIITDIGLNVVIEKHSDGARTVTALTQR